MASTWSHGTSMALRDLEGLRRIREIGDSAGLGSGKRLDRESLEYFSEARRVIAEEERLRKAEEERKRMRKRPPYSIALKVQEAVWRFSAFSASVMPWPHTSRLSCVLVIHQSN